ncbi:MAG: lamin tail domain-containing protein [Candidatus Zhuqueibacterota bacterium]
MKRGVTILLVLFSLLVVSISFGQAPALKINEFLASNDTANTDPFGGHDDWIEIYNAGTEPVDIGGMFITDDLTEPNKVQIPATRPDSTTIQPGGFLIIWADDEPEQGVLHVEIKLGAGGEQIGLYASDAATVIDTLTFGDQTTDQSAGRLADGENNWVFFSNPTPGYTNRMIPIIVNEFLASNDFITTDPYGENDDCIEIMNVGIFPVNIGGMYVTDKLSSPTEWQIPTDMPDSTTLQPGQILVLWADKQTSQGVFHVDIKLSGDGEQIGIFASDGITVIDSLSFGPQLPDTSYGRISDGMNSWTHFSTPSLGASNSTGVISAVFDTDVTANTIGSFELYQNYPNPFNSVTTIRFNLPQAQKINISVFNVIGQKIATLIDGFLKAGRGEVHWDAANQVSGVYFYQIKSDNYTMTRRMVLLK